MASESRCHDLHMYNEESGVKTNTITYNAHMAGFFKDRTPSAKLKEFFEIYIILRTINFGKLIQLTDHTHTHTNTCIMYISVNCQFTN